ncbi:MAG: BMP family protein [Rhizobiaceae bacterium]
MTHFSRRSLLKLAGMGTLAFGLPFAGTAAAAQNIRIRGLFETPLEEPFVTQLHLAMQRIAEEGQHDYKFSESVKAADFSRVLRQWCSEGVELIVGDAYGTEQICRRVAGSFTDTKFVMGSALGPTEPNFATFYGLNFEAAYLAGMVAAGVSKSGKIGAVAGVAVPSTYGLLNAFKFGAQEIRSDIEMKAAYIGSFFDPPKAKEATIAMADQGVDVVFAERIGVIEAAKERGMVAIGNMTDQSKGAEDTVVTSVIWDPYPIIKKAVEAVTSGSFAPVNYGDGETIAEGVNYLAPYGNFADRVPAEVKAAVEEKMAQIKSGKATVPYDETEL